MTNMTDPRIAVAALLQDVHALMNTMKTTAEQLQYWLNMTADAPAPAPVAAPAPVPAAPVPVAAVPAPAKRGRKPKPRNQLQVALETIIKTLPKRSLQHSTFDQVVLLDHSRLSCHGAAHNVWSFEVGSGLDKPVAVFHRDLLEALKRAGVEPTFSIEGDYLLVSGEVTTRVRINGVVGEEWPREYVLPPSAARGTLTPALIKAIEGAAEFASDDRTRTGITCVLLDAQDVVATDGHRLEHRLAYVPDNLKGVRIDSVNVKAIAHFNSPEYLHDGYMVLTEGYASLRFRLGADLFPDWRRVVPGPSEDMSRTSVTFDRQQLLGFVSKCKSGMIGTAVLRLPGCVTADEWVPDAVELDELMVDSGARTKLKAFVVRPTLKEDKDEYQSLTVGVTPDYLTQALQSSDMQYVTLHILDEFAPLLVSDHADFDKAREQDYNVLMPKRI